MGAKKYNSSEKAAILLMALGEELAGAIVKEMSPSEVRHIAKAMSKIERVEDATVDAVMEEFRDQLLKGQSGVRGGQDFTNKLLRRVYNNQDADLVADAIGLNHPALADTLLEIDSKPLATYLSRELPQTIVLVLAHLEPSKMGEVLKLLPSEMHHDLVIRLSKLESVDPEVLDELDAAIRAEVKNQSLSYNIGGAEKVAAMLNQLDTESANKMLLEIEERDPEMASHLRKQMFQFEDLLRVDQTGIQLLIQKVGTPTLTLALKGDSGPISEHFYSNMSERAASLLREDVEALGKKLISEVEGAKQEIINRAIGLIDSGEIKILDPNEVYV